MAPRRNPPRSARNQPPPPQPDSPPQYEPENVQVPGNEEPIAAEPVTAVQVIDTDIWYQDREELMAWQRTWRDRRVFPERGLDLDSLPPLVRSRIDAFILAWNLEIMVDIPGPANNSLCRQFMAVASRPLLAFNGTRLNANPKDDTYLVLRGVQVDYSPAAINRYYGLPPRDPTTWDLCVQEAKRDKEYPKEIFRALFPGRRLPRKYPATLNAYDLEPVAFVVDRIIRHCIYPMKHKRDLHFDKALLLHTLLHTYQPIDIGHFIHQNIRTIALKPKRNLVYYPCLITGLCQRAGVPFRIPGDQIEQDHALLQPTKADRDPQLDSPPQSPQHADPEPEDMPDDIPAAADAPPHHYSMAGIITRLDAIELGQQQILQGMARIERQLAGRPHIRPHRSYGEGPSGVAGQQDSDDEMQLG